MEKHKIDIQPDLSIKVPVICVIGGPGSGKSTLCKLLAKHYGIFHISIGNLLREEEKSGSQQSFQIARALKSGEIVDADLVIRMLEKEMLRNTSHNGYLLDGFPRDVKHGFKFEQKIASINCILFLQASSATLKKRLLKRSKNSDRIDDNLAIIDRRINVYLSLESDISKKYGSKIRKVRIAMASRSRVKNQLRKCSIAVSMCLTSASCLSKNKFNFTFLLSVG
ncbi:adenylate kinase isoenzyme 1-like isoform X2 [Planococcus citri]|uniref:adenylate kinase isoenzyme 1-like isoform X2 n=1 Tax=Planococcus citri TaxID=170843 RepID=UPI0031F73860